MGRTRWREDQNNPWSGMRPRNKDPRITGKNCGLEVSRIAKEIEGENKKANRTNKAPVSKKRGLSL